MDQNRTSHCHGVAEVGQERRKPRRNHKCLLETFRSHINTYNIKRIEKIVIRICSPWMVDNTFCSVLRLDPKFITYKSPTFQRKEWLSPKWRGSFEVLGRLYVLSYILTHQFPVPTVNLTHVLTFKRKKIVNDP